MLTCIYHPIDGARVLEADEAEKLQASGVWFDCPKKASDYRKKVESEIKDEADTLPKTQKIKGKTK